MRTTDPRIAASALNQAVQHAERMVDTAPDDPASYEALLPPLLERAAFFGKVDDLTRVVELGEKALALRPNNPDTLLLRARTLSAVHRFDEALPLLDRAEKQSAEAASHARTQRGAILLAQGKYDDALTLLEAARQEHPTTSAIAMVAVVNGRMGRLAQAEALFDRAVAVFNSVAPSQLAWIEFERGRLYAEAGQPDRARAWYRAVVKRLPHYGHAAVHLAALLEPQQAIPLLETTERLSDDPDVLAALADSRDALEPDSGRETRARAVARFQTLMEKLPEAFADHAGWFYLSVQRTDDAVAAAELNLRVRQGPDAYELLVAALSAAGEHDEACLQADEGMAHPYPSSTLRQLAATAYRQCGKADQAAALGSARPAL